MRMKPIRPVCPMTASLAVGPTISEKVWIINTVATILSRSPMGLSMVIRSDSVMIMMMKSIMPQNKNTMLSTSDNKKVSNHRMKTHIKCALNRGVNTVSTSPSQRCHKLTSTTAHLLRMPRVTTSTRRVSKCTIRSEGKKLCSSDNGREAQWEPI